MTLSWLHGLAGKGTPKWIKEFYESCDYINPPDMDLEFTEDCES